MPPDISNFWPFVLTFDGFLFGPHTILKGLKIGWSFFPSQLDHELKPKTKEKTKDVLFPAFDQYGGSDEP